MQSHLRKSSSPRSMPKSHPMFQNNGRLRSSCRYYWQHNRHEKGSHLRHIRLCTIFTGTLLEQCVWLTMASSSRCNNMRIFGKRLSLFGGKFSNTQRHQHSGLPKLQSQSATPSLLSEDSTVQKPRPLFFQST